MARGNRKRDEDVPNELDSVFRQAVLRPYRASPRQVLPDTAPEPAAPARHSADETGAPDPIVRAKFDAMHEEVVSLQQDLGKLRADLKRQRENWTAERTTLLARVDELTAELAARDSGPRRRPTPRPNSSNWHAGSAN